MIDLEWVPAELRTVLLEKLQENKDKVHIPPPVFTLMQGEIITYDLEKKTLDVRFPVTEDYSNPYGSMQGGMIAAAVDNTIGPLSMLVAPANFTRSIELDFRKIINTDTGDIIVSAKFLEQRKRQLFFSADVVDSDGMKLATAKSVHWLVNSKNN